MDHVCTCCRFSGVMQTGACVLADTTHTEHTVGSGSFLPVSRWCVAEHKPAPHAAAEL